MNRQLFCHNSLKRLRLKELSLFVLAAATFSIPASCSNKASNNIKDNSSANTEQTTETPKCQGNLVMKAGEKAGKCVAAEVEKPDTPTPDTTLAPSPGSNASGSGSSRGPTRLTWLSGKRHNSFSVHADTSSIRDLINDIDVDNDEHDGKYRQIKFKLSGGWAIIVPENKKPKLRTLGTLGTNAQNPGKKINRNRARKYHTHPLRNNYPPYLKNCTPKPTNSKEATATISISANNLLVIDFGETFWTTKNEHNGAISITNSLIRSPLKYHNEKLRPTNVDEGGFEWPNSWFWPWPEPADGIKSKSTVINKGCFKFIYGQQNSSYTPLPSNKDGIRLDDRVTLQSYSNDTDDGKELPNDAFIRAADDEDAAFKLEAFLVDDDDEPITTIEGASLKYFISRLHGPYAEYVSKGKVSESDEDEFIERIEELIAAIAEDLGED